MEHLSMVWTFLKALAMWAVILILAIGNGALREKALIPAMGNFYGLIISGVLLSCGIFLVALFATPWYGDLGSSQYGLIGVLWVVLTLVFEFVFGLFVQHKEWVELLRAYTFKGGNLWPIVLGITLLSPWLAAWLRGFA